MKPTDSFKMNGKLVWNTNENALVYISWESYFHSEPFQFYLVYSYIMFQESD